MGGGNFAKVFVVLVIILVAGVLAIGPLLGAINLGLDLQGGVHVELQAIEKDKPVTDEDMKQLEQVMRQRVDELGVAEPIIQRIGEKRLSVDLAGVTNTEEAVEIIGKTAQLEFKKSDGTVILTGNLLKDAQATIDPNTQQPEINLEFDAEGTRAFAEATAEAAKYPDTDPRNRIAILLDGEVLTNPTVKEPIPSGRARITGGFDSYQEAANIAALLRGGALPVSMEIIAKQTVGPTLGADSLEKSKIAVIAGLIAISLFMISYYRLPGLIANFSLVIYALIVLGTMVLIKAVLTLPGIAGLLLSVGMAVDANIIIYERVKEELRNGKTLRSAVEAGFKRAFWTVFDANVTTLIAAAVLYYLGTGPIRGFAVTLSIGILASMFTAITLTRWLLRMVVKVDAFKRMTLYGVRGGAGNEA